MLALWFAVSSFVKSWSTAACPHISTVPFNVITKNSCDGPSHLYNWDISVVLPKTSLAYFNK